MNPVPLLLMWLVSTAGASDAEGADLGGEVRQLPPLAMVVQERLGNPDGVVRYHSRHVVARWGTRIQVLEPSRPEAPPRIVYENPRAAIFDLNVSYDARTLWFSMREGYEDNWHLYEINVDGTGLRQITHGPYHDFAPAELADGRLVFVSTRVKSFNMCAWELATALFTVARDGSGIRQLTANTLNEFSPQVLPDGRILYTRWEYVDRDVKWRQKLWTVNPDGTQVQLYHGNTIRDPAVVWQARPIPETDAVVATFAPHHGWPLGAIGTVTKSHGVEAPRGVGLHWITQEYPEILDHAQLTEWAYRDPFPIARDRFLVAYGGGRKAAEPRFRIYLLTADDRRALVWDDDQTSCTWPLPLAPRPRPPVLIDQPWLAGETTAVFLLQSVYAGLGPGIVPGEVRWLRVLEQIPKFPVNETEGGRWRIYEMNPVMGQRCYYARRCLGVVPVEADGSACFRVPAFRELYFQALDAEGRAIQSMGSAVSLVPGERQTCIGCHENRHTSPPAKPPRAARKPPVTPEPYSWGNDGRIEFCVLVQPVLDRHCVRCHAGAKPDGGLNLSGDKTRFFNMAYDSLFSRQLVYSIRLTANDSQVIPPKQAFAFASRLRDYIEGRAKGHEEIVLTREERERLYVWMDSNANYYGRYERTRPGTVGDRDAWAGPWYRQFDLLFNQHCRGCHPQFGRKHFADDSHWINLTHPEQSWALTAHLAESAGGYGIQKERDGRRPPLFASSQDAVWAGLREAITAGSLELLSRPRMDMPGAVPVAGPSDWGRWPGTGSPDDLTGGAFWHRSGP